MVNRTSADSKSLPGDSYLCSKYTTYITSQWKIFTIAIYSTNTIVSPTCRRILTYVCHVAHVKTYSANTPSNAFTCYRRRNKQVFATQWVLQKYHGEKITYKRWQNHPVCHSQYVLWKNHFWQVGAMWHIKMIHVTCIPWSSWHFLLAVQCRRINNRSFPKTVGANTEHWPCYFYGIALYHK